MGVTVAPRFPYVSGSNTSRILTFIVSGSHTDYQSNPATGLNGESIVIDSDILLAVGHASADREANSFLAAHCMVAEEVAWLYALGTYAGLAKREVSSIRHITDDKNDISFEVEVTYGELQSIGSEPTPQPNGTIEISRTTTLEPVHVTNSIAVLNVFGNPNNLPTHGTAINVDEAGNINGGEELEPRQRFTLDWTLEATNITDPVRESWEKLVGKTNADTFDVGLRTYQIGELRFMGHQNSISYSNGSERNSFEFEYRANIADDPGEHLTIAGVTGIWKNGFDLLDPILGTREVNGRPEAVIEGFKRHQMAFSDTFTGVLPTVGALL